MKIEEVHCTFCRFKIMAVKGFVGGDPDGVSPGDILVCKMCGTISVFNDELRLRAITEKERQEIRNRKDWPMFERAIILAEKMLRVRFRADHSA